MMYLDLQYSRLLLCWLERTSVENWILKLAQSWLNKMNDTTEENTPLEREQLLERLHSLAARRTAPCRGLQALQQQFNLDRHEILLIDILRLYLNFKDLEDAIDENAKANMVPYLTSWLDCSTHRLAELLDHSSRLFSCGIVESTHWGIPLHRGSNGTGLTAPVHKFLLYDGQQPISSFLLATVPDSSLPLEDHRLSPVTIQTACAALLGLSPPGRLLIYGSPGTGKTEFVRRLLARCGLTGRTLQRSSSQHENKIGKLLLAGKIIDAQQEVLVVDEAEYVLNAAGQSGLLAQEGRHAEGLDKSITNEFLDNSPVRMIFLVNDITMIPAAVLRRFTYHLEFPMFTSVRRQQVWKRLGEDTQVLTAKEREYLALRYPANPARIRQVLDVCTNHRSLETDYGLESDGGWQQNSPGGAKQGACNALEVAEELLNSSSQLLYGQAPQVWQQTTAWRPELIHTNIPIDELVVMLQKWQQDHDITREGLNLLMYGVPGTGKTAVARHIAKQLDLEPMVVRTSELLGAYVGETEKRIRSVFTAARQTVLVIDEADSLLGNRSSTQTRWERSATNELLTSMENFEGLFIATTNMKDSLDPACVRRFGIKLELHPSRPEQRLALVAAWFPDVFPPGYTPPKDIIDCVERLEGLTPGDVAAVAQSLRFRSNVYPDNVVEALQEELRLRQPSSTIIGFTAE